MWYNSDQMRIEWGSKARYDAFWAAKRKAWIVLNQGVTERLKKQYEEFVKPHPLQKMFSETRHIKGQETMSTNSVSGGFFLLVGGFNSSSHSYAKPVNYTTTVVHMAWKNWNDEYCITKIPLSKIRMKFGKEISVPTASFHLTIYWGGMNDEWGTIFHSSSGAEVGAHRIRDGRSSLLGSFEHDQQGFFDHNLSYAVISCKESDWPQSFSFPLGEQHIKEIQSA